jgi:hypothetical protein
MRDPLRERHSSGRWTSGSTRATGKAPHRPIRLGGEKTDALPLADSTPHTAVVVHFHPQTNLAQIGHNGGPLLAPDDPHESWHHYCWRRAHKSAWKTPPREIALRRLERAEALGMTYRDYTLEILERGRYL